jgi:hypothetical protein
MARRRRRLDRDKVWYVEEEDLVDVVVVCVFCVVCDVWCGRRGR